MASAFYNSDVLSREVDVQLSKTCRGSVQEDFEIERCIQWITTNNLKTVALQFPDHLLEVSALVVALLEERLEDVRLCVLGDTSYGSCCVDEVAAEHYSCDSLIHYGHACLSPTRRLPVLYVFVSQAIDVQHCCEEFRKLYPEVDKKVVILYDTNYAHCVDQVISTIVQTHQNVIRSYLPDEQPDTESDNGITCSKCGRLFRVPASSKLSDYAMFFIGAEGPTLTNLIMNYNRNPFSSYNPLLREGRYETVDISRSLTKRYFMIERAKDADIVGIVVGTLGVADYLHIIEHLKSIITQAGKKFYLFVMGKLNVPKLANFLEIDVYVLVACPESTLFDSSEYMKPVVTPYEMEHACNQARTWDTTVVTDFRSLLPGGDNFCAMPTDQEVTHDVSLVTGKLRSIGVDKDTESPVSGTMSVRNATTTVAVKTAAEHLATRSWQGLEQKLGETPVTKAVEGLHGIASGYTHEVENQ